MEFNKLIPELSVADIEVSKKFYLSLGFKVEYEREEDAFVFVSMGRIQIMLNQVNDVWSVGELTYPFGRGINFQLEVENIDEIFQTVKNLGYKVFKEPFVSHYANGDIVYVEKEFLIQDPDGYLLRFQQDFTE